MYAFQPLIAAWKAALTVARQAKDARFGRDARDGERLLTGPYDWMYATDRGTSDQTFGFQGGNADAVAVQPRAPSFRMQVNKTAELVQLFGPVLYHKNPKRFVEQKKPFAVDNDALQVMYQSNPQMAMAIAQLQYQGMMNSTTDGICAKLMDAYINATPNPLDLKTQARICIDEALIKGASCLWTECYVPDGTQSHVVGSFYDTIDNLLIDPGARTLDACKFIVRRRVTTVADCAKKFGLDPKELKGKFESPAAASVAESGHETSWLKRARGSSLDMIVWYEIWSKAGLAATMKSQLPTETQRLVDTIGTDYAYIVLCDHVPYPLNCPPQLLDQPATPEVIQAIQQRFTWPIEFWRDGSWPFEMYSFHTVPNDPWPLSHLAPAMGELKFLNWFYSFIAGKVLITSRDFIAVKKSATDALKQALQNGSDLTMIELGSLEGDIDSIVKFLQHPMINNDLFKAASIIEHNFEKRTGLSELMYGQSGSQYRSAAEAEIKHDAVNVRPDDMANKVEDSMSKSARLEAVAARLKLQGQDVQFMIGQTGGIMWDNFITRSDPAKFLYETLVRIEAGSIRKPNRSRDAENASTFIQQFGQPFVQWAAMGIVEPFNAMMKMYCLTKDIDPKPFMLAPAPQMPPPAQGQQGPPPR